MATQAPAPKTPSYVFGYLPNQSTKAPSTTSTEQSKSFLSSTSTLLTGIYQDTFTAPRSMEEQRIESLRQAKASVEGHIAAKQRAGIAVGAEERTGLTKIEGALGQLIKETSMRGVAK